MPFWIGRLNRQGKTEGETIKSNPSATPERERSSKPTEQMDHRKILFTKCTGTAQSWKTKRDACCRRLPQLGGYIREGPVTWWSPGLLCVKWPMFGVAAGFDEWDQPTSWHRSWLELTTQTGDWWPLLYQVFRLETTRSHPFQNTIVLRIRIILSCCILKTRHSSTTFVTRFSNVCLLMLNPFISCCTIRLIISIKGEIGHEPSQNAQVSL